MKLWTTGALLVVLLLSCSAPSSAEECNLPAKMQQEDLHKLSEVRWVLLEGFADYPAGVELLKNINSSIVEMQLKDNKRVLVIERDVVVGKCLIFRVNFSVPDVETSNHTLFLDGPGVQELDGVVTPYDDQGRADIYQSCPTCLLIVYHGVFEGTPGRILVFYRSEGKHLDAEELKAAESEHRRMAECLKFNVETSFRYDGKADFCLEKTEGKAKF
ncbi:saxitoxin and tetrodotoxin-binding protein 1 isoform X2 [Fundulus heteroclitus]|uniref:saxitoxin and tetrodotoxin-binding protein 1 isoform X2 n=1 Tax=Fundulus heteroclitus TaxID=8078 RepID=UPI00165A7B65|nr:saxitoxin and tetrodotoxin-binding protein 1 isoform X2 [Fundulus heteroclitus]